MLHICAYHALRRVRSYVSRRSTDSDVSKFAVNAYRALLRTDNLEEAKRVAMLMTTVFGRKKRSEHVDRARKQLEEIQELYVQCLNGEEEQEEDVRTMEVSEILANLLRHRGVMLAAWRF